MDRGCKGSADVACRLGCQGRAHAPLRRCAGSARHGWCTGVRGGLEGDRTAGWTLHRSPPYRGEVSQARQHLAGAVQVARRCPLSRRHPARQLPGSHGGTAPDTWPEADGAGDGGTAAARPMANGGAGCAPASARPVANGGTVGAAASTWPRADGETAHSAGVGRPEPAAPPTARAAAASAARHVARTAAQRAWRGAVGLRERERGPVPSAGGGRGACAQRG